MGGIQGEAGLEQGGKERWEVERRVAGLADHCSLSEF